MANKIRTEINLDVTGDGKVNAAVNGVSSTVSGASKAVERLNKTLSVVNISSRISAITNSLSLLKGAISTVSAIVEKPFQMVSNYAAETDKISKFSRTVGLSAADLQKWQFAARRGGVANEEFNRSLVRFSLAISKAAGGSKEYLSLFNALGISVKKDNGQMKDSSALLLEVADAYSKISNAQDKMSVNEKLFGKSGTGLINVLEGGSEGASALLRQREELGGLVSPEDARQAEEFMDVLENVQTLVGGIGKSVSARLLPAFSKLFDKILSWWKGNSSNVLKNVERFGESASKTVMSIVEQLPSLLDGASYLLDKFTKLVDEIGLGKVALLAMIPVLSGPIMSSVQAMATGFGMGGAKLDGVMGKLQAMPAMVGLVAVGIESWSSVFDTFRKNWDLWKNTSLKEVVEAMGMVLNDAIGISGSIDKSLKPLADALSTPEAQAEIQRLTKDYQSGTGVFDPNYGSNPNLEPKIFVDFKNVPKGVSVTPNQDFNNSANDMSVGYAFSY